MSPLTADDVESIPFFGDGFKVGKDLSEGNLATAANDVHGVLGDIGNFAKSAGGKASWADPLSMLANHGFGFLLSHCGALKHAMEAVTGDSGTVTHAAETWGDIAKDLKELAHSTQQTVGSGLKDWGGQGAQAAGKQLAELVTAIDGIGTEAANMQQLLAASASLMEAALDIVKSIISDLVSWLIMTWIAAQAAAVPSLGSSEAVALEASVVEIEITSVRVGAKVMEVERMLVRIEQVVVRIERTVGTQAQTMSKLSKFKSAVGSGIKDTLKDSTKSALTDAGTGVGAGLIDQTAHSDGGPVSQSDITRGLDLNH
ncbi:MAG: WXG100 family type VII secretion target [Actinomycetota bacterium]|nr:WXG100 family type VII secretion target [Actinomycetota bacterium]